MRGESGKIARLLHRCPRQQLMQHGTTVLAFVEDPDGYKIELIQKNGVFGRLTVMAYLAGKPSLPF